MYLVLVPPNLLPLLVVGQRRVEKRLARAPLGTRGRRIAPRAQPPPPDARALWIRT